jgi:hypothetical protein
MKKFWTIAAAAAFLAGSSAVALSESTSNMPPGKQMQKAKKNGTFTGPGASDYAPGHQAKKKGVPGHSGSAPGQGTPTTTGSSIRH